VTTLIKTCRSGRKAEDNQQVVTTADQQLAPSLSTLGSRFAMICHNYYYFFMTAAHLPWARTIRLQLQQLYQSLSLLCVFSNLGNLLFPQS